MSRHNDQAVPHTSDYVQLQLVLQNLQVLTAVVTVTGVNVAAFLLMDSQKGSSSPVPANPAEPGSGERTGQCMYTDVRPSIMHQIAYCGEKVKSTVSPSRKDFVTLSDADPNLPLRPSLRVRHSKQVRGSDSHCF